MYGNTYRCKPTRCQTVKLNEENVNNPMKRHAAGVPGKTKVGTTITNSLHTAIKMEETKSFKNSQKTRPETVWERLSKAKKVLNSSEYACTRPHQHRQDMAKSFPLKREVSNVKRCTNKRGTTNSLSPDAKKSLCTTLTRTISKPIMLPIVQQDFYLCKTDVVKEIMTPRSLSNSKSSLGFSKSSDIQVQILQKDSKGLRSCRHENTYVNLNTSRTIITKCRDILQGKKNSTPPSEEELNVLKAIIKSDQRHTALKQNDSALFKDILKTQLKSIVKHESIVKSALSKLDSVDDFVASQLIQTESSYTTPMVSPCHSMTSEEARPNKLEVDVVFKNVPSLEREIALLRSIGEKLQATLNNNLSPRSVQIEAIDSISPQIPDIIECNNPTIIQFIMQNAMEIVECNASVTVTIQYIALKIGIVREFRIAQKTIIELKEEANKPFYISTNDELKRTSFCKLKQNPNILMRHIKPKSPSVPFNILDQDPIFFNNILFNKTQSKQLLNATIQDYNGFTDSAKLEHLSSSIGDGEADGYGDGCTVKKSTSQLLLPKESHILQSKLNIAKTKKAKSSTRKINITEAKMPGDGAVLSSSNDITKNHSNNSLDVKGFRKRIREAVTPMPLDYEQRVQPKNNLIRTICIGIVQLSLFVFLIVTFTYPGPKC